jgi:flagellar M-ring protein FliF
VPRRIHSPSRRLFAVPGLEVDDVTILDSTGQLLASGDDVSSNARSAAHLGIVQNVQQRDFESNIDKALAPFLGMDNFRSSVTAQLNTDSQQVQETTFDPDSASSAPSVTREGSAEVAAKPARTLRRPWSRICRRRRQRGRRWHRRRRATSPIKREEQTNYEINSKTTSHDTQQLQDREALGGRGGQRGPRRPAMVGQGADQTKIDAYIAEMQQIVATAAGVDTARGDVVTVNAMDFLDTQLLDDAAGAPTLMEQVGRHAGSMINAAAFVLVALLVIWFGLRPLARSVGTAVGPADNDNVELPDFAPGGTLPATQMEGFGADFGFDPAEDLLGVEEGSDFKRKVKEGPERRLARMVEINEERAAKILRKWALEEAA